MYTMWRIRWRRYRFKRYYQCERSVDLDSAQSSQSSKDELNWARAQSILELLGAREFLADPTVTRHDEGKINA